jgi:hypothetical protein
MPTLAAREAAADRKVRALGGLAATKRVSIQTRWFLCLPLRQHYKTVPEPFSYLARRFLNALTASTDAVPVPSTGTANEVGPLAFSPSSRGQSLGGALWRAAYAPGGGQTSTAYPSNPVQYLYMYKLLCNC